MNVPLAESFRRSCQVLRYIPMLLNGAIKVCDWHLPDVPVGNFNVRSRTQSCRASATVKEVDNGPLRTYRRVTVAQNLVEWRL